MAPGLQSSHVLYQWRVELRVLGMRANLAPILRAAAKFQPGAAAVGAVGRSSDGRQIIIPVGQCEAVAESAVGPQSDRPPADGHFRVRFGRAVNDKLGIDVEPKTLPPLQEPGMENCAAPREEISCASCRRISSVISSEPIQTRRTASMVMTFAKARS